MSTDYNYDEQGQFFPFFVLTITGLITIPVTYNVLKPSKELENTAPRIKSFFIPEHADLIERQRRKQKRRERKIKRMVISVLGWTIMVYMVYLIIVTARTVPRIWDPYDVLGISTNVNEKQIKSHYRKLSLTQHPDKVKIDPANNVTAESVNDRWVEITKAFKALTDEEIRNNYIQYGHPDGKQSFSIGIALPKFIVAEGNGKYVLILYGALLGVILPYLVGKWWYGTQSMTKERVLVSSSGDLFKEYSPDISESGILAVLSAGGEFKDILPGSRADTGLEKVERLLLAGDLPLSSSDKKKIQELEGSPRRKALALLWAYLCRVDLQDSTLNEEKYAVAPDAFALNDAFTAIALAHANTKPALASYRLSQNLIQAMSPGSSPLLQLPHITPAIAKAIEGDVLKTHYTVQDFMSMKKSKRKQVGLNAGLTEEQYSEAVSVASQLPHLQIERAFFKVVGEKTIAPGSLVQLVIKARFIPPGSTRIPEVDEAELEDVDPDEGDLDALHGRKRPKMGKVENSRVPPSQDNADVQPPLAHAPYFARDHSPRWHIFLAESKQGKIAVPPTTYFKFDKPIFNDDGKPTFAVQTLKMQFGAPPQPGKFRFLMHLICDSYVGLDSQMDVKLVCEEVKKVEEVEEDEISEPEEDSIAGQMQALKTGVAPQKKQKKAKVIEEESSDESDTEGEVDTESETDTDTSTDEE